MNIPPINNINSILPFIEQIEKKYSINSKIQGLFAKRAEKEAEIKVFFEKKDFGEVRKLLKERQKINGIMQAFQKHLPSIDDDAIFEVENQMEKLLTTDFPEKAKFQEIYDKQVLPLLQERKKQITERSIHSSVIAAGEVGKAVQAGLRAIKTLTENRPVIQRTERSQQQVFVLPKEKAVFKHSHRRAEEEERLVNDLFNILSKKAVVGSFSLKSTSRARFGMSIAEQETQRGYPIESLDPSTKKAIASRLSPEDALLMKQWKGTPKLLDQYDYEFLSSQKFAIKQPGKGWETVTFQDLQRLNYQDNLNLETLIGFTPEDATRLSIQMEINGMIPRALNYSPSESPTLILTPDLKKNPYLGKAYGSCEKCSWSYKNASGNTLEVDFKTLLKHQLRNEPMFDINCRPLSPKDGVPTGQEFQDALTIPWKVMSPELMQLKDAQLLSLEQVQAKPFVKNMILMKNLNPAERNALLNRLTQDSELNAIWTGDLQLLDLHDGNLGLEPDSTPEFERFKDFRFSTTGAYPTTIFYQLLKEHLAGKIQGNTPITYIEDGIEVTKELKDLPELQKALDVPWKFVIFDTDLSLFEDNQFSLLMQNGQVNHLIPFRSCLLETAWKDRPLSDETVRQLIASGPTDKKVNEWTAKLDAPLYRKLSPDARKSISEMVAPFVEKYNLSIPRYYGNYHATIKDLKEQFVSEIAGQPLLPLWKEIENDLSYVKVLSDDTWETLAKRYHQDPRALQAMNYPLELKTGSKIKIYYVLTLKRRKTFAADLFPRLTKRQQDALIERQERRKTYLTEYQKLKSPTLTPEQMEAFVKNPAAPLTTLRREDLLKELPHCKTNPRKWSGLKAALLKEFEPTYFNVMRAQYPNLADAYALNQIVCGNDAEAGRRIGLYYEPLEKILADAKTKLLSPQLSQERDQLVYHLATKMATNPHPTFMF